MSQFFECLAKYESWSLTWNEADFYLVMEERGRTANSAIPDSWAR
jgi:hypothetical protein